MLWIQIWEQWRVDIVMRIKILIIGIVFLFSLGIVEAVTFNNTEPLNGTDTGDWMGTTTLSKIVYVPYNGLVYLAGSSGVFGVYNDTSNVTTDLRAVDTGNWIGTTSITALTFDSTKNLVYLAGSSGVFGFYNISSNKTTNLSGTDTGNWFGNIFINSLAYDSTRGVIYLAGSNPGLFGVYNVSKNVSFDLSGTDTGNWIGGCTYNYIKTSTYDSTRDLVYLGGGSLAGEPGLFGVYNATSNVTSDLRATDRGNWIGTVDIKYMTYDSSKGLIYLVGSSALFGVYNVTINFPIIVTDS